MGWGGGSGVQIDILDVRTENCLVVFRSGSLAMRVRDMVARYLWW